MTTVTHPHSSVTICNALWGSRLSFSPFRAGDQPLQFDDLFPEESMLVDTCREARLDCEPLELCKLLLASNCYNALGALLRSGVVSATQPLSPGRVTLAHLACALALPLAIQAISKTQNGSTNSSSVWSLKDEEGRMPEDVCFNQDLAKKLPHRPLFGRKRLTAGQPLHPEDKERVFQLARHPDSFYSLVVKLQTHHFNVNTERDASGDLLIHVAVQGGLPSLPLLLSLLNHFSADISARDRNGMTPLSLACRLGHVRVVEVLVCVGGADLGSRSPALGQTALHCAAQYGHPDIIRVLLRRGADASAEDENKCDAVFLAKKAGFHECRQIVSHHIKERIITLAVQAVNGTLDGTKLHPSDVCQVTDDGTTLLILAASHGHAHLLSQLVHIDKCPLDYRQMKIPDLLDESMELSAHLKGLPNCGDHPFKTALHCASQAGHLQCVRVLLDAHAHPALPDRDGWLPIHYACDGGHVECVKAILDQPAMLGLSGLRPALSLAKEQGNSDILALLHEAVVRRQAQLVTPAVFDAAMSGNTELLFTVLENGDDVNPLKEESCDWPLLLAVGFGYLDIVQHLYQFGGHVTQSHPNTGVTPLHVAAREGRENVVAYLLKFTERRVGGVSERERQGGKDINCRNRAGATPLELAAAQGHSKIVQLLLDSGASCCLPDSTGRLLSCPEFSGTQFLLEKCRSERIQTICEALEKAVPLSEFQTIWQGPWDYNLRAESGDTILLVAAKHAPLEVLQFLLVVASQADPGVLVAGGTPSPLPRGRMTVSPEDSDHTTSDNHAPLTPTPTRRKELESSEERSASVLPTVNHHRKRPERAGRFSFSRARNRPRAPAKHKAALMQGSDPSGASNCSSEEDVRSCSPSNSSEPSMPHNTGICGTIIRAVNPLDGQTALHRAAEAGRYENLTLLLKAVPDCANAKDRNGDTALHMACRNTHKKPHRQAVGALLACDQVETNVMNNMNKRPEDECPHSKTRKTVVKRRTDELDLPTPPSTDPRKGLQGILEGTGSQESPLSYTVFQQQMEALKKQYREVTSDQDN